MKQRNIGGETEKRQGMPEKSPTPYPSSTIFGNGQAVNCRTREGWVGTMYSWHCSIEFKNTINNRRLKQRDHSKPNEDEKQRRNLAHFGQV